MNDPPSSVVIVLITTSAVLGVLALVTTYFRVTVHIILRIRDDRKFRSLRWALLSVVVLSTLKVLIVLLALYQPVSAYQNLNEGQCWPHEIAFYSIYIQVAVGILSDLIYSLMTTIMVCKLTIEPRKKLFICGLMCMGLT